MEGVSIRGNARAAIRVGYVLFIRIHIQVFRPVAPERCVRMLKAARLFGCRAKYS